MLKVEEYLAKLLAAVEPLPATELPLDAARGLVLARDLPARVAVPPFTNSAMDGFALCHADFAALTGPFQVPVSADIPAGTAPQPLQKGTVARIMTGAALPPGADTVVKVEDTNISPGPVPLMATVQINSLPPVGANVRHAGENAQVGKVVLTAGATLSAGALASAASLGYGQVPVRPRVRVGIVATGSELVAAGQPLHGAQIPDSNSILLAALVEQVGGEVSALRRCPDDAATLAQVFDEVAACSDLIITSGGISAGAFDPVKELGAGMGLEFTKVAMQPGMPQGFGYWRGSERPAAAPTHAAAAAAVPPATPDLAAPLTNSATNTATNSAANTAPTPVLMLPGNPVSVFVSFHVFARAFLARLQGEPHAGQLRTIVASATTGWSSPAGKRQIVPVHLEFSTQPETTPRATPTHHLGSRSHLVASLHRANALALIGEEVTEVSPWQVIDVLPV